MLMVFSGLVLALCLRFDVLVLDNNVVRFVLVCGLAVSCLGGCFVCCLRCVCVMCLDCDLLFWLVWVG